MNIKKYEMLPYELNVLKTDMFKNIQVKISFKRPIKKEEITIRNIVGDVLLESCKAYPSRRELIVQAENLYGLRYSSETTFSGKYIMTDFNLSFLNEKYTEDGMNEKSIVFLLNMLLEPNVNDKVFNEESVNLVKENLKKWIIKFSEQPRRYSSKRMLEEMCPDSILAFNSFGYLEDIEKINGQNLFKLYESMLKSDHVSIYVCGDVDDKKIKQIFTEYFTINTFKKKCGSHYVTPCKARKKVKKIVEKRPFSQSQLVMGAKIDKLTPFERQYVLYVYNYILGGSSTSKLFESVREKNSLCYTISSNSMSLYNVFKIQAGIDASNSKKAITLIKKEMTNMVKGKFTDKDIKEAISIYKNAIEETTDSTGGLIYAYSLQDHLNYDSLEDRLINIEKVTHDMVVKVAKKIHLDTIYLMEGDA